MLPRTISASATYGDATTCSAPTVSATLLCRRCCCAPRGTSAGVAFQQPLRLGLQRLPVPRRVPRVLTWNGMARPAAIARRITCRKRLTNIYRIMVPGPPRCMLQVRACGVHAEYDVRRIARSCMIDVVLSQRDDVIVALVTGNVEEMAWIKMAGLGLLPFFSVPRFGGFGSEYCRQDGPTTSSATQPMCGVRRLFATYPMRSHGARLLNVQNTAASSGRHTASVHQL